MRLLTSTEMASGNNGHKKVSSSLMFCTLFPRCYKLVIAPLSRVFNIYVKHEAV